MALKVAADCKIEEIYKKKNYYSYPEQTGYKHNPMSFGQKKISISI